MQDRPKYSQCPEVSWLIAPHLMEVVLLSEDVTLQAGQDDWHCNSQLLQARHPHLAHMVQRLRLVDRKGDHDGVRLPAAVMTLQCPCVTQATNICLWWHWL